jgi:hypothetical protein
VATAAICAKFTIVDIIRDMAVAAPAVAGFDPVERHAVTIVTTNFDVSTLQGEISVQIVIEGPDVPRNRVMAGFATIFEISFVCVVITMA